MSRKPAVFKRRGQWVCRRFGLVSRDARFATWEEAIGHALGGPRVTGDPCDYVPVG